MRQKYLLDENIRDVEANAHDSSDEVDHRFALFSWRPLQIFAARKLELLICCLSNLMRTMSRCSSANVVGWHSFAFWRTERLKELRRVTQLWIRVADAKAYQARLDSVDDARALGNKIGSLAARALGVLVVKGGIAAMLQ